jgi:hypothetical protein
MLTRSSNLRSLPQRSQPEGFRFVSYPLIRSTNVGNICSYAHQYPRSLPRILVLHRGPFDFNWPRTSDEDIYQSPGACCALAATD